MLDNAANDEVNQQPDHRHFDFKTTRAWRKYVPDVINSFRALIKVTG